VRKTWRVIEFKAKTNSPTGFEKENFFFHETSHMFGSMLTYIAQLGFGSLVTVGLTPVDSGEFL